jgi:leader peptidase (prepilin peptidase)/N-methyltransferase
MYFESFAYALLGLIIGSFLNVCIYRIPLDKSIVSPSSRCPHCGIPIRFFDNVPILSFLLLRGKCRECGKRISFQYPIVELLSALAFYGCARTWLFTPPTYVNSLFLAAVIILIFTDYNHRILPNIITLPGVIAGILLSPFQMPEVYSDLFSWKAASMLGFENSPYAEPWIGSILGAIIGGGLLYLVAFAYEMVRRRQGLGMGDVKMMAMVGAFMGWRLALMTIFIGSLLGTFVGILLILLRKIDTQGKLAFGVFLGMGSALCLFYGFSIIRWYLRMP